MNFTQTDVMSSTHTHVSQIGLDLSQQKSIIERKIQSDLLKILLEVQNKTQQKIKQEIKDRQVYIMFEPDLGCDPKNDHLYPKNILPLFDQAITTAFQQSNRATILCLQKYIFEGINQLELNDLSNDLEMQDLEIMNLQISNRKLIKMLEDTNRRNQAEHKKLLEYLIKLKEQLFQVSNTGNAYAPDMGMFDSNFMLQQTAEPVNVEDIGTDFKTKIIQKLRQRLHKLEETLAKTTDSIQKQALRENEHIQKELETARKEWEVTTKNANSKIVQQQLEIEKLNIDLHNLQDAYDKLKLKENEPEALNIAQQDRIKELERELETLRYDSQVQLDNQKGKFDMIITKLKNQLKKYTNQSFNIDSDDMSMTSKFDINSPRILSSKRDSRHSQSRKDLKLDLSNSRPRNERTPDYKGKDSITQKNDKHGKTGTLEDISESDDQGSNDVSRNLPKLPNKNQKHKDNTSKKSSTDDTDNEDDQQNGGTKKKNSKNNKNDDNDEDQKLDLGLRKNKKQGGKSDGNKNSGYDSDDDSDDVTKPRVNRGKDRQHGKTGQSPSNKNQQRDDGSYDGKSKDYNSIKDKHELKQALMEQLNLQNGQNVNVQEIFQLLNPNMSLNDLYEYRKQIDDMIQKMGGSVPQSDGTQQANGQQQQQNGNDQTNSVNKNQSQGNQYNQQFAFPPNYQFKCQKCGQMSGISEEDQQALKDYITKQNSLQSTPNYCGNGSYREGGPNSQHGNGQHGHVNGVQAGGSQVSALPGQQVTSPGYNGSGGAGNVNRDVDLAQDDLIIQENSLQTGSTPNYNRRPGAPLNADGSHHSSRPDSQLHNTPSIDQNVKGPNVMAHSPISGLNSKPQQILRKNNHNGQDITGNDMTEQQIAEFNMQQLERLLKSSKGTKNYDMILHAIKQNQQLWNDIRALEEVNELQEAAQQAKNIQLRDFAVQVSPGYDDAGTGYDIDSARADQLAEAAVNRHIKIKSKVRGKQPFNKMNSVIITGYRKVRGANVFERLYNYAKILRAKIEQRSRDLTMMGFKGVDLGQSEVYAENFYYQMGTGIKQTPRREKFIKED